MTEHMREPWGFGEHGTYFSDGPTCYRIQPIGAGFIADTMDYTALDEANARRIIACVNALAGVPTEDLEAVAERQAQESVTGGALRSMLRVAAKRARMTPEDEAREQAEMAVVVAALDAEERQLEEAKRLLRAAASWYIDEIDEITQPDVRGQAANAPTGGLAMTYYTTEPTEVFEGTAKLMISGRDSPSHGKADDEKCICCKGPHVFGAKIAGVDTIVLHEFVHKRKQWIEGKRIRVTFEVLPDA